MSRPVLITGFTIVALLVMGQSCSINVGQPQASSGGFFRSDDGGKTWRQKTFVSADKKRTTTIAGVTGLSIAFDPINDGTIFLGTREHGIWKTVNRGERWTATGLRTGGYPCIAINSHDSHIVYAASAGLVSKTIDGGATWKPVYQESQPGHAVICVAVDPIRPDFVWAFTGGGKVLFSENAGTSWTLKNSLPKLSIRRIVFDEDGNGDFTIFAFRNIYHLRAAATILEDLTPALKLDKKITGTTDIRSVSVTTGPGVVWLLGTAAGPLESLDHGASWVVVPTVLKGSVPVENITLNGDDEKELYFTVGQRLHHTVDHGQSWAVTTIPGGLQPVLLTYDPVKSKYLYYATFTPLKK